MIDKGPIKELVVMENPIEYANRYSALKALLSAAGFAGGLAAGYFGSELLARGLEGLGVTKYILFCGCAGILLTEIKLRRFVKYIENEFVERWKSESYRDQKEELKIHLLQLCEVILMGFNGAMGLNVALTE